MGFPERHFTILRNPYIEFKTHYKDVRGLKNCLVFRGVAAMYPYNVKFINSNNIPDKIS